MSRFASLACLGLIASSLCFAAPALADGFIIVDAPLGARARRDYFPLEVRRHDVSVKVRGLIAETTVDQVFFNPNSRALEGTYIFPLPRGASVTRLSLFIDGKETEAELLDADKARSIYEGIVRRAQDPALLEYAGRGLFRCRVFPLPARGSRRLKISYSETLERNDTRVRYRYQLSTERFSARPLERCSITIDLQSREALRSIFSPSHSVTIERSAPRRAKVLWSSRNTLPSRDFELHFESSDSPLGLAIWNTPPEAGEDGYFLLNITPGTELAKAELARKDLVLVLDTSGSMAGPKLAQAQAAIIACIDRLGVADRFNIVSFATEARALFPELKTASDAHRAEAKSAVRALRARGGTAIHEALEVALSMSPATADRPFYVVFATDGRPTIGPIIESKAIVSDIAPKVGRARVFTLGIGTDLDVALLDRLAEVGRGDREYVLPDEDLEVKLSALCDKISFPALTNPALGFSGLEVHDVYPKQLPELFYGQTLTVVGRYRGVGSARVSLSGTVGDEPLCQVLEAQLGVLADSEDFLPVAWARQKLGFLIDQQRLAGPSKELAEEIVRVARRYGLPSPGTSLLVVEDDAQATRPTPRRRGGKGKRRGRRSSPHDAPRAAPESEGLGSAFDRAKEQEDRRQAPGDKSEAARASRKLGELKRGERSKDDDAREDRLEKLLRHVGPKTFYREAKAWIDSELDAEIPRERIEAFSARYFELLRAKPELSSYFALGSRVIVQVGSKVFEVTPPKSP